MSISIMQEDADAAAVTPCTMPITLKQDQGAKADFCMT